MAIYNVANVPEDARRFAAQMGISVRVKGNEMIFKECPYCHAREKDNQNRFSLNLTTGQFQCFRAGCGAHGNMITLSKDFGFSLGQNADEYYHPQKIHKRLRQPKAPIVPKDRAVEYLESRGIPEEITKRYEISTQNDRENILLFPFFDENGVLVFMKCRDMDYQKEKGGNKEYVFESDLKPILFGMKQCVDFGRLVITEGQIDSLSVAAAGIDNAVSVPMGVNNWNWVPYCWDWITKFEEIVVFGDHEKGHITLVDEIKSRFSCKIRVVREEDYQGCKDANELLQKFGPEAVQKAVEQAHTLPVRHLVSMSDVEDLNLWDIEKLKTGIKELDDLLYGGLPFGSVILIGGKRGDGKSTFASQILVNALDQGYISMAYSGEMPNSTFKAWFSNQAAGPQNIVESVDKFGNPKQFITNSNMQLLNSWYEDRIFLYDSNISEDEEQASILNVIENAIKQYGVRVILIDNLMTAMYDEPSEEQNKFDRQGRFVQQLAKTARRYNVIILLVAHTRKASNGDANDDISGSGDITNLASITMSYSRGDKGDGLEDSQRKLVVAKNRLFGKTDFDGIILNYDEKSKRIFGKGDDLQKVFTWEELEFRSVTDDDDPVFPWEDDDDEDA